MIANKHNYAACGNEATALLNMRNGGGASAIAPERWGCSSGGLVTDASASVDLRCRLAFHIHNLSVCCYVHYLHFTEILKIGCKCFLGPVQAVCKGVNFTLRIN